MHGVGGEAAGGAQRTERGGVCVWPGVTGATVRAGASDWSSSGRRSGRTASLARHLGPLPLVNQRGRVVAVDALAFVADGLACPYAD